MKNVAMNEEMAINFAVELLDERYDTYQDHVYGKTTCGCGETNAVIVYGNEYTVKVGFCEHCGTDDPNEVDYEIS